MLPGWVAYFQIECWLTMLEDFERLTNYHAINGWLLIDLRSLKHMMLKQCSKWVNTFKDHLLNYVLDRLNVSLVSMKNGKQQTTSGLFINISFVISRLGI